MSELLKKIKAADKKNLLPVEVPEWGLTVYIKQLTVGERDSFEAEAFAARKGDGLMDNPRSKFLVRTLCDEQGQLLCKPEEFAELAALSSKPMERLFEEAQKHNRLTNDDVEELGKS
jgi:hypothetical protein